MATTLRNTAVSSQSAPVDQRDRSGSVSTDLVALWLETLRQAMTDTDWTSDALDAHWQTSRGYANRLVNGEKAWSLERMLSLPADIRKRMHALNAADFGHVVVARVDQTTAAQQFASGLFNLLTSSPLPDRAGAPLKADLAPVAISRRA